MKVSDPTLGLDQKAQMLLAILATKEISLPGAVIQTKAYYEGGRGCVCLRLVFKDFCKQLTYGQDWNSDQFLVETWEVSIGAPEDVLVPDKVLFPVARVHEVVEYILRELQEAYDMMQDDYVPTRFERLMAD